MGYIFDSMDQILQNEACPCLYVELKRLVDISADVMLIFYYSGYCQ